MKTRNASINPTLPGAQRAAAPESARGRLRLSVGAARGRVARPPRHRACPVFDRTMAILALASLLLVFAVMPYDEMAMLAVRDSGVPALAFMRAITDLGKSGWYLVPSAILFVATAAADWSLKDIRGKARLARLFGQSAFVFAAVAASGLATDVLKVLFGRSRPRLYASDGAWHFEPLTFGSAHYSFPSGHATTIGALTAVLFIWFPGYRWLIAPLGLFVAATRVPALAHYPSDVTAGFAFGFLLTVALARWLAKRAVVFRFRDRSVFPRFRGGA